jgi:transcriptional regulator with GAF, ATPase, and Fis domain
MDSTAQVGRLRTQWARGEISFFQFLDASVLAVASAMRCDRTAVWVFEDTESGRRLRCVTMYDAVNTRQVRAPHEHGAAVDEYFRSLRVLGVLHAHDVHSHPATTGLFTAHKAAGVRSLLGGALSVNGETYGTLVCTNVSTDSHWHTTQLNEMRGTCSQLSLVIADALRDATLTQPAPLTTLSPADTFTRRPDTTWSALVK